MHPPTADEPTQTPVAAASGSRDTLVDALRTVALTRVVLWHAFAAPWLSWVFPAMPVMFFLAGSVLATGASARLTTSPGPASGRPAGWRLFARRACRLLIPFWVYSLVVLMTTVTTVTTAATTTVTTTVTMPTLTTPTPAPVGPGQPPVAADASWLRPLSWLVPPHDTADTDQVWLTGHLWYLTDYLCLLALLPLAVLLARRVRLVIAVALVGLALLELAPAAGLPHPTGVARVAIGDLLCYGMFAVLGVAWAARRATPPTGPAVVSRAAAGAVLVLATLATAQFVPLPRGSLNESYLLLACAALGWLLMISAAERPLRRLAGTGRVAPVTRAVSARALTVYLWHPAAILLALTLVPESPLAAPLILLLTVLFTGAAVLAFGWVEDVAARRPAQWWPGRGIGGRPTTGPTSTPPRMLIAPAVLTVAGAALAATLLSGMFAGRTDNTPVPIPRPSDRTALADSAFIDIAGQAAPPDDQEFDLPADLLQATLEQWITDQPEITDAVAGIAAGPQTWSGSAQRDGESTAAQSTVAIASMTKTFTATLILQFAADGLLDLDAPVPVLPGVAPPADGLPVTPRQLLQHSTGLIQYTEAPDYDPSRVYTAAELVSLSTQAPRVHPPDEAVSYSNSNYLWLGLLLESLSGSDYGALVRERIAEPLGLSTVDLISDERAGWVGSSSGGVTAAPVDVARFFDALLDRDEVLTDDARRTMTDLNHLNIGLGVWPLCPCGETPDGGKWATGLGHFNADSATFAFPDERLAVYVHIGGADDPPVSAGRMNEMREQLLALMRDTARHGGTAGP